MSSFDPAEYATPRLYRVPRAAVRGQLRVWWVLSPSLAVAVGACFNSFGLGLVMALTFFLILQALLLVWWDSNMATIELHADRLAVRYLWSTVEVKRSQITEYNRQYCLKCMPIVMLKGRGVRQSLPATLMIDSLFETWFAGIKDGQSPEFQQAEQAIYEDARLGGSIEQRQASLVSAHRRICLGLSPGTLNLASSFAWVSAMFSEMLTPPQSVSNSLQMAMLLLPWMCLFTGLYIRRRQPSLYTVLPPGRHCPQASVFYYIFISVVLVWMLQKYRLEMVSQPILLPTLALACALVLLFSVLGAPIWRDWQVAITVVLTMLLYSHAAVVVINRSLEPQPVSTTHYRLIAKEDNRHLLVRADSGKTLTLQLPADAFDHAEPGADLCVNDHRGVLGIPWSTYAICPSPPQATVRKLQ